MARARDVRVISHWNQLVEHLQVSPLAFYTALEQAVLARGLPKLKISRVDWREGGWFSARREYLRIERGHFVFDICGVPWGNGGFFVSWWLGTKNGSALVALLSEIPATDLLLRWIIRPGSYYKIDTALIFQESVHRTVLQVIDQLTAAQGLRQLSEAERKPVMQEFFG